MEWKLEATKTHTREEGEYKKPEDHSTGFLWFMVCQVLSFPTLYQNFASDVIDTGFDAFKGFAVALVVIFHK